MSVSNTVNQIIYVGNGSTETPYEIPFPFLQTDHIIAAKSDDGIEPAVTMDVSDYTVTRNEDGQGGTLVTTEAIDGPATITIQRYVPLQQPTTIQRAGPLDAEAVETMADRLLMQIQQLNRRINVLEGTNDGDFIRPPLGSAVFVKHTQVFTDAAERGATKPQWEGQLGIQVDDQTIYVAQSTNTGDWLEHRKFQKVFTVVPEDTELPADTTFLIEFLPEATAFKRVFVSTLDDDDGEVEVIVTVTGVAIASLEIADGDHTASATVESPNDEPFAAESILRVQVINPNFGSSDRKGLVVTLDCRNF